MPHYKDHLRRQELWKHNALLGHARMMEAHLQNIIGSLTATDAAKEKAFEALTAVRELQPLLRSRKATALNKALDAGD